MDVVRSSQRGMRETSPDRVKICKLKQKIKPSRKVQVVYYLSRNGLLEHPHFMEVTLLPNQPLRLKDVFDRLKALRGSGMPLQYSWSSKRNYKSGYVWHDLAVKDIIYPAEGGEYVLKGSELVEGCSERFNVSNKQGIEANYNYKYDSRSNKALSVCKQQKEREDEYEEYEEQEKEYEEGEKTSYTSSTTTPHSRCSRGVSTEEVVDDEEHNNNNNNNNKVNGFGGGEKVKRREKVDGDGGSVTSASGTGSGSSRYSVLLQLIACGSTGSEMKGKQGPRLSDVGMGVGTKEREKKNALFWEDNDNVVVSENPRLLGNSQAEEKEYFSGSLVESIKTNRVQGEPVLNKSHSYNEERRSRLGMMEEEVKEQEKRVVKGGIKDRCIPLMKSPKQISSSFRK